MCETLLRAGGIRRGQQPILSIEFRLVLYNFGVGAPDGRDLITSLDTMCTQLRTLSLVVEPTS